MSTILSDLEKIISDKTDYYSIRRCTEDDVNAIVELSKANSWNYSYGFLLSTVSADDDDIIYFGAFSADNNCLGYISIDFRPGKEGLIRSIIVDTSLRKAGIGSELINTAEKCIKDLGVRQAILHVRESNTNAQNFYLNRGYIERERLPKYYMNGETALTMIKAL